MKKILALILSLAGCGAVLPEGKPEVYEYSHNTCAMYPYYYYKVDVGEDGQQRLSFSNYTDTITVVRLNEDVLGKIGEIVSGCRMHKIKESYTPSMLVLDGYTWHLSIKFPNTKIYSSGQNARPKGSIREGIEKINEMLKSISAAAAEEDIIGYASHNDRRP
ncbi:MAG: hypothetical protein IKR69_05840 [Bacteroidales bacterium]|nr:hypothetical protein [Bacteroidales bacterium]